MSRIYDKEDGWPRPTKVRRTPYQTVRGCRHSRRRCRQARHRAVQARSIEEMNTEDTGMGSWKCYRYGGECPYCGKWVRPKPIIGFSHLCKMNSICTTTGCPNHKPTQKDKS